nr:cytochrome b [Penenirmus auritus]
MPSSITYFWNMGSLLGVCLVVQLLSGVFLSLHYNSNVELAFESVLKMMEEVKGGWTVRLIHANCASMFFVMVYLHIARGLYYKSFLIKKVWLIGVTMLLLLMGEAFMGYVLPWGQMSFWGATVITNLLSAFPMGESLVLWIWGGFSVSNPTLTRFFSFHFVLPFVMLGMSLLHILLLHETGSSNPLGLSKDTDKVNFHPYYSVKDLLGLGTFLFALLLLVFEFPDILMDPDNFSPANPMVTPVHIQPEWYFLFAYAILRSIPNKLGGVVALLLSVSWLYVIPLTSSGVMGVNFDHMWKSNFFVYCSSFILLTWIGAMPVGGTLVLLGQCMSVVYFLSVIMMMAM